MNNGNSGCVIIFMASVLVLLSSCGTYVQRTQVGTDFAYLQVVGKVSKEKLILNDSQETILGKETESFNLDGKTITQIRIKAGKNRVKILRKGMLIVDRIFYISPGDSFELEIP